MTAMSLTDPQEDCLCREELCVCTYMHHVAFAPSLTLDPHGLVHDCLRSTTWSGPTWRGCTVSATGVTTGASKNPLGVIPGVCMPVYRDRACLWVGLACELLRSAVLRRSSWLRHTCRVHRHGSSCCPVPTCMSSVAQVEVFIACRGLWARFPCAQPGNTGWKQGCMVQQHSVRTSEQFSGCCVLSEHSQTAMEPAGLLRLWGINASSVNT